MALARGESIRRLKRVARLLASQTTLALATTNADGTPHVTPLFYFPGDDLALYWFSSTNSRHSRNLKRQPEAAVTVYLPVVKWRGIRGVQMRGAAGVLTDPERRMHIAAAYAARFQLGPALRSVLSRSRLYEFRPAWVRYLDNSVRFGYRFEITLAAPHSR